jgi:hypothetical protein
MTIIPQPATQENHSPTPATRRRYLLGKRADLASIVFTFPAGSPERLDTLEQLTVIANELQALRQAEQRQGGRG